MKDWRGIVAAIEHMLQYRKSPLSDVAMLHQAILRGGVIAFSAGEIWDALEKALASDEDLGLLIPQPHSDETIRDVLLQLKTMLTASMQTAS